MATTLKQNRLAKKEQNVIQSTMQIDQSIFGEKVGLMGKLFGCGHRNLSRPFSQSNVAYRSCLQCGARKQFNLTTLETYGEFYYPPLVKAEKNLNFHFEKQRTRAIS